MIRRYYMYGTVQHRGGRRGRLTQHRSYRVQSLAKERWRSCGYIRVKQNRPSWGVEPMRLQRYITLLYVQPKRSSFHLLSIVVKDFECDGNGTLVVVVHGRRYFTIAAAWSHLAHGNLRCVRVDKACVRGTCCVELPRGRPTSTQKSLIIGILSVPLEPTRYKYRRASHNINQLIVILQ